MSWVRYDDGFHDHPKVAEVIFSCPEALALHLLANTWTSRNRRGGFIPAAIPRRLMGCDQPRAIDALVAAGLWEAVEGGWRFHDWDAYQPVSPERSAAQSANAKRRWSAKAQVADANGMPMACQSDANGVPSTSQVMPARARPVPVPEPIPEEQLHTTATQSRAPTAQSLIDEWIAHCSERPPGRVVGQVAREIKTMLTEGVSYSRVRAGLVEWSRRGLHPSTLPSVVHELSTPRSRSGGLTAAELFAQAAAGNVT